MLIPSTKKIIALVCLSVLLTACENNKKVRIDDIEKPAANAHAYTLTEDFEQGAKPNYADGKVTLSTGVWSLKNALLGNAETDVKNGRQAVRLRAGSLVMNFDINGVTQISIKHAKYGAGADSDLKLFLSTDGGKHYTLLGIINVESESLVTDSFAVTTPLKARFKITKKGAGKVNIDDIIFKGTGNAGITLNMPDTALVNTAVLAIPSNEPRGVTIGADAPPATGDNSNLLFGNPSGAKPVIAMADNYLMDMGYYVESYNSTKAGPNWVSWHLDATNTTNVANRLNNFAAFNGLPVAWYTVKNNSYHFINYGFDKGHNCPSADRTSSVNANSATFLMTNMIPQAPQNNQHTWSNFESYIRTQVTQGNEAYIIMGSYGTGGTGTKGLFNFITDGTHQINVPANIWKVAVIIPAGNMDIKRVTITAKVIAINTPNNNTVNGNWKKYIVTVRDIEKATGYNILSNLPQNIQDAVETKKGNF